MMQHGWELIVAVSTHRGDTLVTEAAQQLFLLHRWIP